MNNYRTWRRKGWVEEEEKDFDLVPETLGYPDEERMDNGDLRIYLQRQPDLYVVIGKFKENRDGAYYTRNATNTDGKFIFPKYHDNVILAVAQIYELIEQYNKRN